MPQKRLEVVVDGRRVTAVNTWFSGEWIEVDGVVVAKAHAVMSTQADEPLVVATVVGASGAPFYVEVFMVAIVTTRMMITVNGRYVAGDRLHRQEEAAAARAARRLVDAGAGRAGSGAAVAVPVVVDADR